MTQPSAQPEPKPAPACLVISYHFPPQLNSSGLLRIISFVRALTENGWDTTVLSCDTKAYQHTHPEQLALIPPKVRLERCFARHTAKSLSWKGKYADILALPDALQSWILPAIWRGWRLIRQHNISVILSSYPLASAQVIGYALHRLSGVRWVADLRDPMLQNDFPSGKLRRALFGYLERKIFRYASQVCCTTESCATLYRQRYPEFAAKLSVIANGYDERLQPANTAPPTAAEPLVMLHSGLLNNEDRNPSALLDAIALLHQQGHLQPGQFQLMFRAADQHSTLTQMIQQRQLQQLVSVGSAIPFQQAIAEMQAASVLLLLQGPSCNQQIPAKLYEYLYCQRPLLALCHEDGEVAALCQKYNLGIRADITDATAIAAALLQLLAQLKNNSARVLSAQELVLFSRHHQAMRLLQLMQQLPPQG